MASMIELIKILRERTGAGMGDCNKALKENGNDIEKACDWLREQGIAKSAKKAGRIAAEGLTGTKIEEAKGIIVEVNCETDFVAKGERFVRLVEDTKEVLLRNEPTNLDDALELTKDLYTDAAVALGEKISLRRFDIFTRKSEEELSGYVHMGGKISVLVLISKHNFEFAKGLAMHIAANAPVYISKSDVPSDVVEHEMKVALETAKLDEKLKDKKPEQLENILKGKVNKIIAETTLMEQKYLLDPEKTVAEMCKKEGLEVVKFVRYQVGEGIEKRQDDFAAEVMGQIK